MAESRDSSSRPSMLDEKLSNVVYSDNIEEKILHEISSILSLSDTDKQKDKIMNDLLENGRQSLVKYEDDIISKVYKDVMNGNDSELMVSLKKFYEHKFETQYSESAPWFISFLKEYKEGENRDIYDDFFNRTAHYGLRYMKDCPLLSVVLQLLFEGIDDAGLIAGNVYDQLWCAITSDGIKSITKFSDYIIKWVMNKQLKKESILFQALREYYRERVFSILKESNIVDKRNLYALTLNDIVMNGWLADLKSIEENLAPISFRRLREKFESFREDNYIWSRIKCNGCHILPLIGKRYYCTTCFNYDLCVRCEAKGHPHYLTLVPTPQYERQEDAGENEFNKKQMDKRKQRIYEESIKKQQNKKLDSNEDEVIVQSSKKPGNTINVKIQQCIEIPDTEEDTASKQTSKIPEIEKDTTTEQSSEKLNTMEKDKKSQDDNKQYSEEKDIKEKTKNKPESEIYNSTQQSSSEQNNKAEKDVTDYTNNGTEELSSIERDPKGDRTEELLEDDGDIKGDRTEEPIEDDGDFKSNGTEESLEDDGDFKDHLTDESLDDDGDFKDQKTEEPKEDDADLKSNRAEEPKKDDGDLKDQKTEEPKEDDADLKSNRAEEQIKDNEGSKDRQAEEPRKDDGDLKDPKTEEPKEDDGDLKGDRAEGPLSKENDHDDHNSNKNK